MKRPVRPPRVLRRPIRALAALVLGLGVAWLPVSAVNACSCGFPGYERAIALADFAFVGTVIATDTPAEVVAGAPFEVAMFTFDVQRAKEPMDTPVTIEAIFGGDPNCGFDMAVGETWLVIAQTRADFPDTGLCDGTRPLAEVDEVSREIIDARLTVGPPGVDPVEQPDPIPAPSHRVSPSPQAAARAPAPSVGVPVSTLVAIAAALALGLASILAVRRVRAR